MPMLENVKVSWAEVLSENKKFGGWGIEVAVTPAVEEQLKELGLSDKIKTQRKDYSAEGKPFVDCAPYIKLRRYPQTKAGKKNKPPIALNADKSPLTSLIGNGSICNVLINVYPSPTGGMGVQFTGVQVVELVEYAGDDESSFTDVSGSTDTDADAFDMEDMYAPLSS